MNAIRLVPLQLYEGKEVALSQRGTFKACQDHFSKGTSPVTLMTTTSQPPPKASHPAPSLLPHSPDSHEPPPKSCSNSPITVRTHPERMIRRGFCRLDHSKPEKPRRPRPTTYPPEDTSQLYDHHSSDVPHRNNSASRLPLSTTTNTYCFVLHSNTIIRHHTTKEPGQVEERVVALEHYHSRGLFLVLSRPGLSASIIIVTDKRRKKP